MKSPVGGGGRTMEERDNSCVFAGVGRFKVKNYCREYWESKVVVKLSQTKEPAMRQK
jgi:hypothetical protein